MQVFRAMKADFRRLPQVGRSGRYLGVRPKHVGSPANLVVWDIPVDEHGCVHPGAGGMSVAPATPSNLPKIRRPESFGGDGVDPVFCLETDELGEHLRFRLDKPKHGLIEPAKSCTFSEYEDAIYETLQNWEMVDV